MPLTEDQIAFENDWAKRWLAGTRSLKPELWVDPFYKDDAVIVRGNLPSLEGIHAIREGVAEMCQVFSLFDASNPSVVIDEKQSRLIILCDMVMALRPDPEQKRVIAAAAIIIKKALGENEEKMIEEHDILDRSALAQRLSELGLMPGQPAE